jgi:hypothetical protein
MLRQWNLIGAAGVLEIQTTEHGFKKIQQTDNFFDLSIVQLWLFSFRHFVHKRGRERKKRQPFQWPTKDASLSKLATLASRLGFKSEQISLLQNQNLGQNIAQGFFQSYCREQFYAYEEYQVRSMSNKLWRFLQNLPKYVEKEDAAAQFVTNDPELEASHRFNSPTRDEYERQRRHMFADQLFNPDQQQSQYVTSLGVTQDILFCFFGKDIFQQFWNKLQDKIPQVPNELELGREEAVSTEDIATVNPTPLEEVPMNSEVLEIEDKDGRLELESYPSGTPDRDIPPLAVGFEEISQPIEKLHHLLSNRRIPEILSMWFQSQQEVILLYLFETRMY